MAVKEAGSSVAEPPESDFKLTAPSQAAPVDGINFDNGPKNDTTNNRNDYLPASTAEVNSKKQAAKLTSSLVGHFTSADPSDPSPAPAQPESDASSPDTDTEAVVDGGFLSPVPGVPVPLLLVPGADCGKVKDRGKGSIRW